MKNLNELLTKKIAILGMAAVLISSGSVFAANTSAKTDSKYEVSTAGCTDVVYDEVYNDEDFDEPMTMEEYINTLTFLTKEEKDRLLKTEKELEPLYAEIEKLGLEANDKTDYLAEKISATYEKIYDIWNVNYELLDKMFDPVTFDGPEAGGYVKFLNSDKKLSAEDKKKLLPICEELDVIHNAASTLENEEVNLRAPFDKKIEVINEKISVVESKNGDIWAKIEAQLGEYYSD